MNFQQALKKGEFLITAEIFPPKGIEIKPALDKALALKGLVHAINVTDNQRAIMRMNPVVLCHEAVSAGMDAIYQMSCRDRNSMGLSSDLLAAYALGIRNILSITGDYPSRKGKMLTKPVFEMDSVQLIDLAKKLEGGRDNNGNSLASAPSFCVGAVVNPNSEQLDLQVMKLKKKIDAGAEFIQTQVVYDADIFKRFMDRASGVKTKYLLGIFPLKSFETAKFMEENVPGVVVGEKVLKRMSDAKDPEKEGLQLAVDTIKDLRAYCGGVHFMTMNDIEAVKKIIAGI